MASNDSTEVSVEECQRLVGEWYPQESQLDQETWENALLWFLSRGDAGNKCLLTIVDGKDPSSARIWTGSFSGSGPNTILNDWAALGDGRERSQTPQYANFIRGCQRGGTSFRTDANGQLCGYGGSCVSPETVAYMSRVMGGVEVTAFVTYGIPFGGGNIMFHDGMQCEPNIRREPEEEGRACASTWGCVTLHPMKMRRFCEVYLGDSISGSQGSPGGTYFFVKPRDSMPARGTCESSSARRLMKQIQNGTACTGIPNIDLGNDSGGAERTLASTDDGSTEQREDDRRSEIGVNRTSAGSSTNIFQAIQEFFNGFFQIQAEDQALEQEYEGQN